MFDGTLESLGMEQDGEPELNMNTGKGGGKAAMMAAMKGGFMEMCAAIMATKGCGKGKGAGGGPGGGTNWKGELNCAFQKSKGGPIGKGEIQYEVSEVEGSKKFQAAVTISGSTITGEPAESKRNAEHNAAKAALEEMFPDHQAKGGGMGGFNPMMMMNPMMQTASGGTKRKIDPQELPAKTRLSNAVQLMKKAPLTKEDVTYSVEELEAPELVKLDGLKWEDGKFVGTVVLAVTGDTYTADKPRKTKNGAENAAAEVALEALKPQLEPLIEEHNAKKARKNKEAIAALKERTAAKKAEQKAQKEANDAEQALAS